MTVSATRPAGPAVQMSLCCGDYDLNRALLTGEVAPKGIALVPFTLPSPERHRRMARFREFDISEFSLARLLMLRDSGQPVTAIPAFPHRRFRHGFVFVRGDSPLRRAEELQGARIGLRVWQNSAGLWMRGILHDEHGIDLRAIAWVTQDEEDLPYPGGLGFRFSRVPSGRSVWDLLESGQLDAVIYPDGPGAAALRSGRIRRLFADPRSAEQDYFRRTGFFPIMHTVVMPTELAERYPWAPRNVLQAFRQAKDLAYTRLRDPRATALAWAGALLEDQQDVLGDDPWCYSFPDNARQLATVARWAREQGLTSAEVDVATLFPESCREELPHYVPASD